MAELETIQTNVNRIEQVDSGSIKNIYVGIHNIDQSILYYLKNIILPKVIFNNEIMNIPILYGNSERWEQIRKHSYIRDESSGKIKFPLIVYRRTSIERDTDVPIKKLQGENPQIFRSTSSNKFIKDDRIQSSSDVDRVNQEYNVIIPNYIKLSYSLNIWTNYIEQMNLIIETLNFYADSYWGNEYFKFKAFIPSFDDQTEVSVDGIRIIKSECNIGVSGYIIPDIHTAEPIITKNIPVSKISLSEREL